MQHIRFKIITLTIAIILLQGCAYKPYQPVSFSPLTSQSTIVQLSQDKYRLDLQEGDAVLNEDKYNAKSPFTASKRPIVEIVHQNDTITVSNTGIKLNKAHNFRDLGGLKTKSGKQLAWGKFYRSGHLNKLKKREFAHLDSLGITTVIDLRTDKEIAKKPDNIPPSMQYFVKQAYSDSEDMFTKTRKEVLKGQISPTEADSLVSLFYSLYPVEKPLVIAQIITTILQNEQATLFHCSAGKDRTGMVAAILLSVLDVDRQQIIDDYILSNDYRAPQVTSVLKMAKAGKLIYPKLNYEVIENFSWIKPMYINAMFQSIDQKYGSMDLYIKNELHITDEQRELFKKQYTR